MSRSMRQMLLIVGLLGAVLTMGTVGFHVVEGWRWFDSFYMALVSLTTVGYEEVHPLTESGRIFNSALLIVDTNSLTYRYATCLKDKSPGIFVARSFYRNPKDIERLRIHEILIRRGRILCVAAVCR